MDLYEARRRKGTSRWARVVRLSAGVLVMLLAPVTALVPGPGGILVFALGFALLAAELRPVARALDWLEPKLRASLRWTRNAWRGSPVFRFALVVLGLALLGACVALGAWKLG